MDRHGRLGLHEQVILLALRDEKGTVESGAGGYGLALGGAILAELLIAGRVEVTKERKGRVALISREKLHDPVLDEALERVATAKRERTAAAWVSSFAGLKRLKHRVAEQLCRRGILRDDEDRVLLLFKRKLYPTIDPGPEARLVAELRQAVFSDSPSVAPRTAVLVSLAHVTGLLAVPFSRKELKPRRKRLDQLIEGQLVAGATREAVQAVQAIQAAQAAMVAITAATSATH